MTLSEILTLVGDSGKTFKRKGLSRAYKVLDGSVIPVSIVKTREILFHHVEFLTAKDFELVEDKKAQKEVTLYKYTYCKKKKVNGQSKRYIVESNWTTGEWNVDAYHVLKVETKKVMLEVPDENIKEEF